MATAHEPSPNARLFISPSEVLYCNVCGFPVEYCDYGSSISQCQAWLSKTHPIQYAQLYPALPHLLNSLSITTSTSTSTSPSPTDPSQPQTSPTQKSTSITHQEALKKESKQIQKSERLREKVLSTKVTIRTVERTKRKRITTIHGLNAYGVDLKKLAKLLAAKFATGSSVTKNNQGDDEIVIQGDVTDEVLDLFQETKGKLADLIGNGMIPDRNIFVIDDTKKKSFH